jgi:FAD dependent oxidoreductase TIGR03364
MRYDLAVIGAGIVGLAHARAAAVRGLKVIVIERDHQAVGSSIRNFGFVTVTGQEAGQPWFDALASKEIWQDVARAAGIDILQRGLYVLASVPEAIAVLQEFQKGAMGEGCRMLDRAELQQHPAFANAQAIGALYSPHELRVEARHAVAKIAAWLARRHRVDFMFDTLAISIADGVIVTSRGEIEAARIVVAANNERQLLYADALAAVEMRPCKLHMLRVAAPGWQLPGAVMSDFGLTRYLGYDSCSSLEALRKRLVQEHPETFAHGVHVIAVQSADGSLVLGDSHHYHDTPDPFATAEVEAIILAHAGHVLDLSDPVIEERWLGVYPSGPQHSVVLAVEPQVRVVVITSGTGMSTAFGLAERVIEELAS